VSDAGITSGDGECEHHKFTPITIYGIVIISEVASRFIANYLSMLCGAYQSTVQGGTGGYSTMLIRSGFDRRCSDGGVKTVNYRTSLEHRTATISKVSIEYSLTKPFERHCRYGDFY
jgi:hypothetical protein